MPGALHRETDGVTRTVLELETYERAVPDGPIVAADVERKTSSGKSFRRLDDDRLVISSSDEHGVESIWSATAGVIYRRPLMTREVFETYAGSILRRIAARLHELVLQHRDPERPCQGLILAFTQAGAPENIGVPELTLLAGARHLPPEEHWDAHEWEPALEGGRELLNLPEYAIELRALAAEVRAQGHADFDAWIWPSVARHLNDLDWSSVAADDTFAVVAQGGGRSRSRKHRTVRPK